MLVSFVCLVDLFYSYLSEINSFNFQCVEKKKKYNKSNQEPIIHQNCNLTGKDMTYNDLFLIKENKTNQSHRKAADWV